MLLSEERIEPVLLQDLQQMADLGLDMLRRSLDAFLAGDEETARQIPRKIQRWTTSITSFIPG